MLQGSTLYFAKHSRYWSFKVYAKGVELQAHPLPQSLPLELREALSGFASGKVREELTLRALELDRGQGDLRDVLRLFLQYRERLSMAKRVEIPSEKLAKLKPHLAGYWSKWRDGTNLKTVLPTNTFYRVRRDLLREVGIDIASPAPKRRAEVELPVRVIEPKRLPSDYVPEWAVGTALFADPSQQPMRLRHVV
jgi:hypothetical protein